VSTRAADLFRALALLLEASSGRARHSIVLIDVDGLTEINRSLGADAGGAVLAHVSRALAGGLEAEETAAHWAGDQYVLLLPGAGTRTAVRRARRLVEGVAERPASRGVAVTATAGVATFPVHGASVPALVEAAHLALRTAKNRERVGRPPRIA
jgi:diguanylate cyclase (GGDEF)-like protein